ncbi:hypothetical protein [Marinomonas spartinae]|uniref:hypothetical protein n=1 Tax=Marinomonas spartinae TaxID=1792290 RepID=UPI000A75995B|nr:hypothetical protein [Marinomonas spartinae]
MVGETQPCAKQCSSKLRSRCKQATVQGVNSLMAIGFAVTGRGAEGIIEKG